MVDRPIIFSAPMVRALLDGRKTQTRRLATSPLARCVPGDRLWVREAWCHTGTDVWSISAASRALDGHLVYRVGNDGRDLGIRWFPSIHMPRWASRLTLIVTDVRVQRLQEISAHDAIAEGLLRTAGPLYFIREHPSEQSHTDPRRVFSWLWNRLHGSGAWDANPEVVALTFAVERRNIDTTPPANRG